MTSWLSTCFTSRKRKQRATSLRSWPTYAKARKSIENGAKPVAVLHAAEPVRRTISECIALLPEDSKATIDADFAKDIEAAVESHRELLTPPAQY